MTTPLVFIPFLKREPKSTIMAILETNFFQTEITNEICAKGPIRSIGKNY